MTDKQLALVLTHYHDKLASIYNQLLEDTRELNIKRLPLEQNETVGDPVILELLSDFIDNLNDDIDILETND